MVAPVPRDDGAAQQLDTLASHDARHREVASGKTDPTPRRGFIDACPAQLSTPAHPIVIMQQRAGFYIHRHAPGMVLEICGAVSGHRIALELNLSGESRKIRAGAETDGEMVVSGSMV